MIRTQTWFWMTAGGAIYQASKLIFGLTPNIETLAEATYWSGGALFLHWVASALIEKVQCR